MQVSYNNTWNKNIVIKTEDDRNSTFYGAVYLDVLTNVSNFFIYYKVYNKQQTYFEQTLNICKFFKGGFFKKLYERLIGPYYDLKIARCPIVKGHYTYIHARSSDILNEIDVLKGIPLFIPRKGNFMFITKGSTIVKKKSVSVFNSTEEYEFVSD
jgi:Protein of unknown function (DUF1091)